MENNKSEFLKDPIEKKQIILKDIWSEILNKPDIGIHDDFFMAGGTSKDLVKMVTKMSEIFEISMQEVFSKSTIAEISRLNFTYIDLKKWSESVELNHHQGDDSRFDSASQVGG